MQKQNFYYISSENLSVTILSLGKKEQRRDDVLRNPFEEDLLRLGNAFDFPDCNYRRFLPARHSFL